MKTDTAGLITLNLLNASLCWLPMLVSPSLDFPWWLVLCAVSFSAALSSSLNRRRWLVFLITSAIGTFAGVCAALSMWWPQDPVAVPLIPIVVAAITLQAAGVAAVSAWLGSKFPLPGEKLRRAGWLALVGIAALGPICAALTPAQVARRIARNERLAEQRFSSLQRAVDQTLAVNPDLLCAGPVLARNYFGPPFSNGDWRRMTGNYVKQDGYIFMLHCREGSGYTIDAAPAREGKDGRRRFCTDESGKLGCGMRWNGSRHTCSPCQEQAP